MAVATLAFCPFLKRLWCLLIEYLKHVLGYLFYYLFLYTVNVEKILCFVVLLILPPVLAWMTYKLSGKPKNHWQPYYVHLRLTFCHVLPATEMTACKVPVPYCPVPGPEKILLIYFTIFIPSLKSVFQIPLGSVSFWASQIVRKEISSIWIRQK
jgi:hypothetical protein